MTLTASQVFDLVAPELATLANKSGYLTLAESFIAPAYLATALGAQAQANLAAHYATLAARGGGATGPVTVQKEGDLSISYGHSASQAITATSSTSYGLEFQRLVGLLTAGGVRVVDC